MREELIANHKMVMKLLDLWKLPAEDQLAMLGLTQSHLSEYREFKALGEDQCARIALLLDIHKNLRILFPRNKEQLYSWIKAKNQAFEDRTPVELVKEFGIDGLLMIRSYLNRVVGES